MTALKLAIPKTRQGLDFEYRVWPAVLAPRLTQAKLDWWRATNRGSTVDVIWLPPLTELDPPRAAARQQLPLWTEAVLSTARAWASDNLTGHNVRGFFDKADGAERVFIVLIDVPRGAMPVSEALDAEERLRDIIFSSFAELVSVRIRRVDGVQP